MKTIKCVIADDEPIARQILEGYCQELSYIEVVKSCKNAFEVMELLQEQEIDLLCLDINMPKLSGLSLLKTLDNPPKVIITTAYPEYALEGYELSVVDYLLKPFSLERFIKAVMKVRALSATQQTRSNSEIIEKKSTSFMVKSDKKLIKLNFEDISHIEAYGNYVKIHVGKVILTPLTITGILEKLPSNFVRSHKSYILNIDYLSLIDGNQIVLSTDVKVPVSKSYRKDILLLLE